MCAAPASPQRASPPTARARPPANREPARLTRKKPRLTRAASPVHNAAAPPQREWKIRKRSVADVAAQVAEQSGEKVSDIMAEFCVENDEEAGITELPWRRRAKQGAAAAGGLRWHLPFPFP